VPSPTNTNIGTKQQRAKLEDQTPCTKHRRLAAAVSTLSWQTNVSSV